MCARTNSIIKNFVGMFTATAVAMILSCGGGGGGGGASVVPSAPAFYGAGEYQPGGQPDPNAVYVDSLGITTLSTVESRANAIFVHNNDIYVAGRYAEGTNFVACYWKNGTCIPLITSPAPDATTLFVSGNNIYIAGQHAYPDPEHETKYIAAYWIDDGNPLTLISTHVTRENTDDLTLNTYATGIYVIDPNVYVAGMYLSSGVPAVYAACYWNNSTFVDLTPDLNLNSYTTSIVATNSHVYIAGKFQISSGGNWELCFWTDSGGPRTDIVESSSPLAEHCTISLYIKGSDVYACGNYIDGGGNAVPFCWHTGDVTVTDLDIPANSAGTAGIIGITDSNDIYIVGGYNDGVNTVMCRWLNGVREDLESILLADNFSAHGFFVTVP